MLGAALTLTLTGCGSSSDDTGPATQLATTTQAGPAAQSAPDSTSPSATTAQTTTASDSATEVISLTAVDAAGKPTDGFTVTSPDPFGTLNCRDATASFSATTANIYHCGASADAADVCWPTPAMNELLCANDPWKRELRRYTVDPPLEPIDATEAPEPWALELADGRHCRIRVGGAWGGRSDGMVGAYSCTGGSEVVLQAADARTSIDKSSDTWQVAMGELGAGEPEFPPPTMVDVRTAYFAATAN
ncbi:hypothetical protein GV794_25490 [Nocardia cyriacigeorgica]|uniref:Uncharacterized protein n=1 Tax=Nocardia cyriacigeorgica TaxID=135487 RepID=A0A6P1DCW6_9NOCA|nr:hypothetical protein [Nocardia cyriacigeorgica]NEW46640.1 hypothetical protein [Nocardia cyriacigeorgica]NEW50832.1 hypothetical protein [Nocardia cyriacigeorgica]NEW58968.1 hypothetical protein [Nocardia cyriacigeorgica]